MQKLLENFIANGESFISVIVCVALFWTFITIVSAIIRWVLLNVFQRIFDDRCPNPSTVSQESVDRNEFNQALLLSILDALATFEVCACSLECWPVRAVAGRSGLLFAIALHSIRTTVATYRDAYGNPCTPWYRFLTGKSSAYWMATTWMLQLLAAQLAFFTAKQWWALGPTVHHTTRYQLAMASSRVPSDLQVSTWLGFLIEMSGTFMEFCLSSISICFLVCWNRRCLAQANAAVPISTNHSPGDTAEDASVEIKEEHLPTRRQFITCYFLRLTINLLMTAGCLSLTGMYINPANAFAHCWGLGKVTPYAHIIVYWLGPFFGVWLAMQAESMSKQIVNRFQPPCLQGSQQEQNQTRARLPRSVSAIDGKRADNCAGEERYRSNSNKRVLASR